MFMIERVNKVLTENDILVVGYDRNGRYISQRFDLQQDLSLCCDMCLTIPLKKVMIEF